MVHIFNDIRIKMVYTDKENSLFVFTSLPISSVMSLERQYDNSHDIGGVAFKQKQNRESTKEYSR